jgi:hypothetical protein
LQVRLFRWQQVPRPTLVSLVLQVCGIHCTLFFIHAFFFNRRPYIRSIATLRVNFIDQFLALFGASFRQNTLLRRTGFTHPDNFLASSPRKRHDASTTGLFVLSVVASLPKICSFWPLSQGLS